MEARPALEAKEEKMLVLLSPILILKTRQGPSFSVGVWGQWLASFMLTSHLTMSSCGTQLCQTLDICLLCGHLYALTGLHCSLCLDSHSFFSLLETSCSSYKNWRSAHFSGFPRVPELASLPTTYMHFTSACAVFVDVSVSYGWLETATENSCAFLTIFWSGRCSVGVSWISSKWLNVRVQQIDSLLQLCCIFQTWA